MGWLGTKQTRAQAVKDATRSHAKAECLAFQEVPAGVWSVWRLKIDGRRIIALDLIEERGGYQMVKTMDETMGPCYYDCPLAFLDLARDFSLEGYSAGWREEVRERHGILNRSRLEAEERAWAKGEGR
jgi:hypothetical protein